jgi:hypothetical protein
MHAPICLIHFGVLYIYHKRQGYDSMKKVSFLLFLVFLCLPLKARAFEPYLFHFQIQDSDKSYVDIECKPGESFRFSVVLTNRGTEVKENTLFISDGYTADNGGTKILTPKEATREAAGGWIRFSEERIALLPGEEKIIELEGRVPDDAMPGDHIAVLYLRSDEEEGTPGEEAKKGIRFQMNRVYALSCAVLIRVEGDADFCSFFQLKESFEKKWVKDRDLVLSFEIENTGNTFDYPEVSIEIFDMENRPVHKETKALDIVYPKNAFQTDFLVPDRLYKEESYKLLLTVSYGSQKKDTVQRQFTLNMTKKEAKQAQKIRQISEDMEKTYLISDRSAILFFAACFMLFISVFLIYYRRSKEKK